MNVINDIYKSSNTQLSPFQKVSYLGHVIVKFWKMDFQDDFLKLWKPCYFLSIVTYHWSVFVVCKPVMCFILSEILLWLKENLNE